MIAGSIRKISLGALLVASAAMLAPLSAHAAPPTVYCVIAYGHENPGNCDPQPDLNEPPYQGRIYPTSQPYGYGEKGLLFVEGNANPGARVTISATDGSGTVTRVVEAALTSDPETGRRAGDFKADLKVTNLGVHASSGGNPNGIAALDVTAIANFGGTDSDPKTVQIDKYALAPGDEVKDTYKPVLSKLKFPPTEWCRYPVNSVGRIRLLNPPLEPGAAVCRGEEDLTGEVGNPVLTCGGRPCVVVGSTKPTGQSGISGLAEDDHANAFGHAGEIAAVNVKITQGATTIRNYGNVANRVNSTQAKWDILLKIDDFEPNTVQFDDPYLITVDVFDAKGNKITVTSTFNVYPF